MKKAKFITIFSCFLLLFGCGTSDGSSGTGNGSDINNPIDNPTEPGEEDEVEVEDLTGYIISISEGANLQILVTGKLANSSGVSAAMYTLEDSTKVEKSNGDAFEASDLQVGMKVTVWNSGFAAQSFPAQSGAVKVVADETQDEHELTAVQKALEEVEAGFPWHVEAVDEQGDHQFKVLLKNLLDDSEPVEIEVEI